MIQTKNKISKNIDLPITESQAKEISGDIVSNIMEGYNDIVKNLRIDTDGDFMLYLSLGTLFKRMKDEGISLWIMLLNPDYMNQSFGDTPLAVKPEELSR